MRALRQKFDMEEASVEMLVNPYKMLDKISSSIVDELRNTAENSPEKLMDTAYLEQMNQRLEAYSSFLVLRRGAKSIIRADPGTQDWSFRIWSSSPWTVVLSAVKSPII